MGSRHPNPRLAKIHRSYSVDEMARLFDVHKNTVRRLAQARFGGNRRPAPDRGPWRRNSPLPSDRRARAKRACGPGRIYCLPCRAPKVPAVKMVECVATSDTAGTLRGICPDCDRMIYRRVNPQKLDAVRGDLDVTVTQAQPRIEETTKPNVNCDSTKGDHR